jgi:hypothetical protein
MTATSFTEADEAYLRANYLTLDELCTGRSESADEVGALIDQGLLPRPAYVLTDGTGMFPQDYFRLVDEAGGPEGLRDCFARRYRDAAAAGDPEALEEDWQAYMAGTYGICLREVTPETIVRKGVLVSSLCELLVLARPGSIDWREALRAQVDELDALERDFAPDYDRGADVERLPTRDLLIIAARERFGDVFG